MPPFRLASISQYHKFRGLPGPTHPLISVFRIQEITALRDDEPEGIIQDFYSIALKKTTNLALRYGRGEYEFGEGQMVFVAPNQVYSLSARDKLVHEGWLLLLHPDFLWDTPLARNIHQYDFFGYAVDEALYLSGQEEAVIINIFRGIREESQRGAAPSFKPVVTSQLGLLLNYAERFYRRQFLTREKVHHQVLVRLERLLVVRFADDELVANGLPTVTDVAAALNVSPNYLSGLLKSLTGKSTQQHIHDKLIAKAKEKLSTSDLTVAEVAYTLGFEYSQSFSKFFKAKTLLTPSEFRRSFN